MVFNGCDKKERNETHSIEIEQSLNGIVYLNKSEAKTGEEIIITCQPEDGYEFVSATANGVKIINNKFTMPNNDVDIVALFQEINPENIALKVGTYVCDVSSRDEVVFTSVGNNYMRITYNQDQTIDATLWDNWYVVLENISYTRQGNIIIGTIAGLGELNVHIIDENTLFAQFYKSESNYGIVFHYKEDVLVEDIVSSSAWAMEGRDEIWDVEITGTKNITIVMKDKTTQVEFNTLTGTFEIYGNRMYITTTNSQIFCAIIRELDDNSLIVGRIGQFILDNEDNEGHLFDTLNLAENVWYVLQVS